MIFRTGFISRLALGSLVAATLSFSSVAVAQEATPGTPEASPVAVAASTEPLLRTFSIVGSDGEVVGVARFDQPAPGDPVRIVVANANDSGLTPGEHGIHIHESGFCDASGETPFESAGGHFNPTNGVHGGIDDASSHAGDLGNLTVNDDGSFLLDITTTKITLVAGEVTSLNDADGSALLIHEQSDDMHTDPSGESGGRIACGLIYPSSVAPADVATPVASPEATPVS